MDRKITEKSLLEDIDQKFDAVHADVEKLKSSASESSVRLYEIEKSYQQVVLFGIFLVASAVIGLVLSQLGSQVNNLTGLVDKSILEGIVVAYFVSIPTLAALLFVYVLRKHK
jgi:hypothetical protein